jgi:hypothetical protein
MERHKYTFMALCWARRCSVGPKLPVFVLMFLRQLRLNLRLHYASQQLPTAVTKLW